MIPTALRLRGNPSVTLRASHRDLLLYQLLFPSMHHNSLTVLHPKYYKVGIQIQTRQEGIGNSLHGLRTASRDRATNTVGAQLGSTNSMAPGGPGATYLRKTGKAQALPRRKTTLVVIIKTSNRKETGTQGVASLVHGIGAGLFPEAGFRGTTP